MSLPPTGTPAFLRDWRWDRNNILAVVAALLMCWGLLDAVLYCDTSYQATFGENRCTLFALFLSTFWHDVSNQLYSLFHGTPTGSISGEITATEWTQCLFVPFIVGGLVYWLWPRLRMAPVRGSAHGFILLGLGLALYVLGYMAENYNFGIVAMEFVYAGLVVLFLGWDIMRLLSFPIGFLLFMWPYGIVEDIAFQLRLLMSALSHQTLLLMGIDNVLNGTAIISPPRKTPSFAIDIADPCSGIRSLFALVMMAALAAFVLFRRWWKMALLVAAALPMVILGNLVRIVMLTVASIHFGEAFALGANDHPSWFHEGAGYVVYLVNFAGLIALGLLLTRLSPEETPTPS